MPATLVNDLQAGLEKGRKTVMWVGVLLLALGILAVVFPSVSTLATNYFIGWVLLLAGALMFFGSFAILGAGPFFGALLFSLLTLACGGFLLFNPESGTVALTIIVAVLFMFDGAYQMTLAFGLRPAKGWGWVLVSAILSAAIGFVIATNLAGTSQFVLGLLVGIKFIFTGIAYIMLARELKPAT